MAQGVEHRDVGRRLQLQMVVGLDVRALDEIDAARVDDDQLGAFAQALLHARAEHRMGVGRIGADDHDHVGEIDALEVLRAGGLAEGLLQAVAGRRVADAGASVDVVVAEGGANHALHDVDFLVGRARGRDAADGALAVLCLHRLEAVGGVLDGLVPGDLAPGIGDLLADHRVEDAILVGGVAEREAALDAGVALVGAAVLVGDHAHDALALHLGLEGAADAAVGAGGDDAVLGLALLDDRFLDQGRGGAGLDAGAARDALGLQEVLVHAGRHVGGKAAAIDGQREGALHLLAGAHAARADDALGRLELEVGV